MPRKKFYGLPLAILLLNSCGICFVMTQFEYSDDVYRYVWRVIFKKSGIQSYVLPPNSSELQDLAWGDFKVPNHPDLTVFIHHFLCISIDKFFSLDNYQYVFCILRYFSNVLNSFISFLSEASL